MVQDLCKQGYCEVETIFPHKFFLIPGWRPHENAIDLAVSLFPSFTLKTE